MIPAPAPVLPSTTEKMIGAWYNYNRRRGVHLFDDLHDLLNRPIGIPFPGNDQPGLVIDLQEGKVHHGLRRGHQDRSGDIRMVQGRLGIHPGPERIAGQKNFLDPQLLQIVDRRVNVFPLPYPFIVFPSPWLRPTPRKLNRSVVQPFPPKTSWIIPTT